MLLNVFLSSPARSLPAFHTWTLLHSRGSQTARCIGPCIIQLFFCANIYIVMSYACMLVDMLGFLSVHLFWCAWILCARVYLSALVFACFCVSVCQSVKDLLWETAPMAGACHLLARSSSARIITCFEVSAAWIYGNGVKCFGSRSTNEDWRLEGQACLKH